MVLVFSMVLYSVFVLFGLGQDVKFTDSLKMSTPYGVENFTSYPIGAVNSIKVTVSNRFSRSRSRQKIWL